ANAADALGDTIDALKASFGGLIATAIKPLLPQLTDIAQRTLDWVKANQQLISTELREKILGMAQAAANLAPSLKTIFDLLSATAKVFTSLPSIVQSAGIISAFFFGTGTVAAVVAGLAAVDTVTATLLKKLKELSNP